MINVYWFRNGHEHRNYWLRFGLMRLHRAGRICYTEYALASCMDFGFDPSVVTHEHRHTSVVLIKEGSNARKCIIDSEDSFFFMSPELLRHADLYFCAGYSRSFFEDKRFVPPYAWQQPEEISFYDTRARELVDNCGPLFGRVRPFVPIGPELHLDRELTFMMRKLRNAHNRMVSLRKARSWRIDHSDFEARYAQLLALRDARCQYDVVLLDTLWGWPRHRYALHLRLRELAQAGKSISARLRWAEPMALDGGDRFPLAKEEFPLETGHIDRYEPMLASSRLAVFATGFHWGWRNIMTLALMWGLPIHADRLLLEPWFDMSLFNISWNEELDWPHISTELSALSDDRVAQIKAHNQAAFDRLLAPERVADYFVAVALS